MNKVMPGVCFMNKQMWELWFGMEIKMGFGIYEVENKEYGVWGFGFRVLDSRNLNITVVNST